MKMLTLKQRAYAILACGPHSACCAFEGFGSGGWDQLPSQKEPYQVGSGEFHFNKALGH